MFSSLSSLKLFNFKYTALVKITAIQLGFLTIVSVAIVGFYDFYAAFYFAKGGLVAVIPAALFGYIFFRKPNKRPAARGILNNFYFGELVKLLTTALLFAAVFLDENVLGAWVFAGYVAAQVVYCISFLNISFKVKP